MEEKPTLIVRCDIVKDVSATGSSSAVVNENLDGEFITANLNPRVKRIQFAEQALREILVEYPGLYLKDLDLLELKEGPLILATIESSRPFTAATVAKFEKAIQGRLDEPAVRLMIRSQDLVGVSSKGRILYGDAHFTTLSDEDRSMQKRLEETVRAQITSVQNTFVPSIDAVKRDDRWFIRAEVVGPKILSSTQIDEIESGTSQLVGRPVTIHAWCRAELIVTNDQCMPVKDYSERYIKDKDVIRRQ